MDPPSLRRISEKEFYRRPSFAAPAASVFPPDDTASNLDPGDRSAPFFPQAGRGSLKRTVLFNDPSDRE
jgi:hypothetical protein